MMSHRNALVLAPVASDQLPKAIALLEAAGLPTSDISLGTVALLGAFDGDRLVATIGLERAAGFGLLRSLAVAPDRRGAGIARSLYERLLAEASRHGVIALYALTNSADAFFTRLGFGLVARSDAPMDIQTTAQFSTLCPSTTRLYRRRLAETASYFSRHALGLRESGPGVRHIAVSLEATLDVLSRLLIVFHPAALSNIGPHSIVVRTLSYFEVAPHACFERHSHEGEQITLVLGGELHFAFDDRRVCVRHGEAIAIPFGVPHEVRAGATPVKAVDAWSPARMDL